MKHQIIINLLDTTSDNVPKFITKNWVEVYDQSDNAKHTYKRSKQIRFKTSMLQSNLCDYSDAYIVVERTIAVTDSKDVIYKKKLAFDNNAPFICGISRINNILIDNTEDLEIVMSTVKIIQRQQEVYKIIIGMNQIVP